MRRGHNDGISGDSGVCFSCSPEDSPSLGLNRVVCSRTGTTNKLTSIQGGKSGKSGKEKKRKRCLGLCASGVSARLGDYLYPRAGPLTKRSFLYISTLPRKARLSPDGRQTAAANKLWLALRSSKTSSETTRAGEDEALLWRRMGQSR